MDARRLARVQGLYYVATGVWPLLSMRSFEWITGTKRDHWLVRTIGLLALAAGAVLVRGRLSPGSAEAARDVGIATALAFGASSGWYGGRGTIRRIYLADAAAEALFIGAWLAAARDAPYSGPNGGWEEP